MGDVLVGVDGSEGSRTALRWAVTAASSLGLPLRVMTAWQYPKDTIVSVGRIELTDPRRVEEEVASQLRRFVDDALGPDAPEVTIEIGRGPAAGALLRAASDGTELAVVGSRGLGGFRGLLLGSVSRHLTEHAPCPVAVVPSTTPVEPPHLNTIVVGIDGSEHASRAMRFAAGLATRAGAKLVVAHAVEATSVRYPGTVDSYLGEQARREAVEEWCAPLREDGVDYTLSILDGDPRTVLLDLARDRYADLLVVGSRGLGPVARLLLGSVASSLVHHGQLPVAIVPRPR